MRPRFSLTTSGRREKARSEEHTSELQSLAYLVFRLLLEKKRIGDVSSWCGASLSFGPVPGAGMWAGCCGVAADGAAGPVVWGRGAGCLGVPRLWSGMMGA